MASRMNATSSTIDPIPQPSIGEQSTAPDSHDPAAISRPRGE
jgi:hypothetical protein